MEFGASWFNVWITLTVFIEFYPEVPRVVISAPTWTLKVSLDSNHSSLIGISFFTGFSRDVGEEQCLHKNKENPHTCTRACRYTWLDVLYSFRQQVWSTARMGSSLSLALPSSIVTDKHSPGSFPPMPGSRRECWFTVPSPSEGTSSFEADSLGSFGSLLKCHFKSDPTRRVHIKSFATIDKPTCWDKKPTYFPLLTGLN